MNKILVIDDELSIRESFSLVFEDKYKLFLAASGEAALKLVTDEKIDLAYLDIRMPGMDGIETLKKLKQIDPSLQVVMVTAINEMQKAAEAIKLGAVDYIVKPFDVDAVLKTTESILKRRELIRKSDALQKESRQKNFQLAGNSEKMSAVLKAIEKAKGSDTRVLLLGETGTEKETVAMTIHQKSPRAAFPFYIYNLSDEMAPAEIKTRLFGLGKGSTIADLKKFTGIFEEVRTGTLFLNNFEYFPPQLNLDVPTRLIAGSSPDLKEKSSKLFRLFSEAIINIPPLRERLSDLPVMANHFLLAYNEKHAKNVESFSGDALEALTNYPWPGNTAQLSALIEMLVLTSSAKQITVRDLPFDILLKNSGAFGGDYLFSFEKEYVERVLAQVDGDKLKAASILEVSPNFIESKI